MAITLDLVPFQLQKRFALTISRGTTAHSENLWIRLRSSLNPEVEGWGEATSFSTGGITQSLESIQATLQDLQPQLQDYSPWDRQQILNLLQATGVPSAAQAAVDMALHDWIGRTLGVPLWQLWGLSQTPQAPLSLTVGISNPQAAQQRLQAWLDVADTGFIKVKLGSPQGIEADQAMFTALTQIAPIGTRFLVDANGGWSLATALTMVNWLNDRGVIYVEQPLPVGQEPDLPTLKRHSPLPLFADESCWTRQDIPALAPGVDGINIKLMKCGGLTEALAMIHTARAWGLQVMLGCYSESTLSNTAAAQLGSLVDYLDLDSHLNLRHDPFVGARLLDRTLIPPAAPGLGVSQGLVASDG